MEIAFLTFSLSKGMEIFCGIRSKCGARFFQPFEERTPMTVFLDFSFCLYFSLSLMPQKNGGASGETGQEDMG